MHTTIFILGSMMLLGLRHGIDHDHIAAITDITALQRTPRRAMRLGLLYASGHAVALFALGAGAVLIGLQFPESWEPWREKIVGATLIALGLSVVASMVMHRRNHSHEDFRIPSRAGMVIALFQKIKIGIQNLFGAKRVAEIKPDGDTPAFLMGVLHGLGAETPSQLMLLVVTAGMGTLSGILCIGSFVTGLFITNTIMCAVMVGLYKKSALRSRLTFVLSGACAAYSMVVGVLYLVVDNF